MSAQPLFYKKVVPLNKEKHKNLYLEPVEGYTFAADTNSLYIAALEFIKAASEYVIVFGKDGDKVYPVVLLGLKAGQNLFVDKKGKWNAEYIPAYARRYPFILATPTGSTQDTFTVCIDESFSGFNTAKEGQLLFDKKGKESPLLKQAIEFLEDYQKQVQMTVLFCNSLVKLDLLEPMQANIEMNSGEKFTVGGFLAVSRKKLKELKPEKLAELAKSDGLELIYNHLYSLNNVGRLMKMMS